MERESGRRGSARRVADQPDGAPHGRHSPARGPTRESLRRREWLRRVASRSAVPQHIVDSAEPEAVRLAQWEWIDSIAPGFPQRASALVTRSGSVKTSWFPITAHSPRARCICRRSCAQGSAADAASAGSPNQGMETKSPVRAIKSGCRALTMPMAASEDGRKSRDRSESR